MEKEQILKDVNEIFCDVLDNEDITIDYNTSAPDIEEWDSLSHIQLVVAIEKHFKVRFTASEISGWGNVGEMISSLDKKLNG